MKEHYHDKYKQELDKIVLKYGKYLVDEWFTTCETNTTIIHNIWIRIVKYDGHIYYSKEVDGESIEFKELI